MITLVLNKSGLTIYMNMETRIYEQNRLELTIAMC